MTAFAMAMIFILAQPLAPATDPESDAQDLKFQVNTIQTFREEKPGIDKEEKDAVPGSLAERLPYRAYRMLNTASQPVLPGVESVFPLEEDYTLYLKPEPAGDTGEIGFNTRIEKDSVQVLKADGAAAERRPLVLHGLPLSDGALAVIITLVQGGPGGGGQQQPEEEEQNEEDKNEEDKNDQDDASQDQEKPQPENSQQPDPGDEELPERPDQQPEAAPGEDSEVPETTHSEEQPADMSEAEPIKDMEHIEAILESLEEMDKREQQQQINQRARVEIRSDCWLA